MSQTTYGRYTLVRRVGTGGMAEIWKARVLGPAGFQKTLAIKKVLPELVEDREFLEMFIEEAKLVADLVHPNIVQVFDFGRVGPRDYFIAMEYVAGTNLARVLNRQSESKPTRLPPEIGMYVTLEACRGLGYAHQRTGPTGQPLGIVHRDVSPQNVLVSFGGEVKVTDFGIARVAAAVPRTAAGMVRGKIAYMSPEQAAANPAIPVDRRADLFSLGVVLYELLTGRRCFSAQSQADLYAMVVGFQGLTPEQLKGVPPPLQAIVQTALHPDAAKRFQNALAMETALMTVAGAEGILEGRQMLASVVQRLFEDEYEQEMRSNETSVPPRDDDGAGLAADFGGAGMAAAGPGAEERTTKQPSGLTLKGTPIQVGQRTPVDSLKPAKQKNPLVWAIGGGVGVLALVAVGVGLAGAFGGRKTSATPTPTPLAAASTATAAPGTPTPARTAVAVVKTPTPAPTSRPSAGFATLSVTSRPWVEVWIDGRKVARETPLRPTQIAAGRHTLRFVNPALKADISYVLDAPAGRSIELAVDAKSGSVKMK